MTKSWSPLVVSKPKPVSNEEYKYSVAEIADIIYNYLCRLHKNKNQNISIATETLTTIAFVKKDGSNG